MARVAIKHSLREISAVEALDGPDIVPVKRSSVPLTPLADKLATLFERAAVRPYTGAAQAPLGMD